MNGCGAARLWELVGSIGKEALGRWGRIKEVNWSGFVFG